MSQVPADDGQSRYSVDESRKKKAQVWFKRAAELVDQRNYDHALKYFYEGLSLNPVAVEEGYIPMRGASIARWHSGGKKLGAMDRAKSSMSTKDPIKGMLNALWRMAHDPTNADYAEGFVKNANKARCDDALFWGAPIFRELIGNEKKPNPKSFTALKDIYEQLGDRCQERGEVADAIKAYTLGLEALTSQQSIEPGNRDLSNIIRDLSTKLTILKGQYDTADTFRTSMADSDAQSRIHDEDRLITSQERMSELLEKARVEMEANPDVEAKTIAYVDLLCKNEDDDHENEAMRLLTQKYKGTGSYRFKQRADDIAVRQLRRQVRAVKASGDTEKYKEMILRQLRFEEKVFRERVEKYPTDLRFKFEHASRLFRGRKFDEAIPPLQQARNEPKVRNACAILLGRCFYEKNLPDQAISILSEGLDKYELSDDDTAKEYHYWLARSLEAANRADEARKTYGKLMEIDYNYRDVRQRIESIGSPGAGG